MPIYIVLLLFVFAGCTVQDVTHKEEIVYEQGKLQKFTYLDETTGKSGQGAAGSSAFMDAIDVLKRSDGSALPELKDLPIPPRTKKPLREFTGLIQNYTNYNISIPSQNSDATLIIPAHGWLEYIIWANRANIYGYVDGKIIFHQKVTVDPRKYKYMGKAYDFLAEIKPPPEVVEKQKKPRRQKRKVKAVRCG